MGLSPIPARRTSETIQAMDYCNPLLQQPLAVLIIDDDPNDTLLLEMAFSLAGVRTKLKFVTDGQEAICYFESIASSNGKGSKPWPDLILLDLKMPKVSGFHVLEWLRDHLEMPRSPIAVLTGSEAPDRVSLSYALGADAFLIKPRSFTKLVTMVRVLAEHCAKNARSKKKSGSQQLSTSSALLELAHPPHGVRSYPSTP